MTDGHPGVDPDGHIKAQPVMKFFLHSIIIIIFSSLISTTCAIYFSNKASTSFNAHQPSAVNNQDDRELQLLKKSAMSGDIQSQFKLGTKYYLGTEVPKDDSEARFWFNVAYHSGSLEAEVNLATMYKYGQGGDKDLEKSLELYRDAARKGSSVAFYNLGKMYLTGDTLEKNERYGLSLLQDACTAGEEKSCRLLQQIR